MPSVNINYLAVVGAAVVNMVIGALWYSPSLFAKQWTKLTGRTAEDMKGAGSGYAAAAVGALIQAWILAHFVHYTGATTVGAGMVTGFWLWLGFVAVTMGVNTVFQGKPWQLFKIDAGYFLVVLLITGGLLAVWT